MCKDGLNCLNRLNGKAKAVNKGGLNRLNGLNVKNKILKKEGLPLPFEREAGRDLGEEKPIL